MSGKQNFELAEMMAFRSAENSPDIKTVFVDRHQSHVECDGPEKEEAERISSIGAFVTAGEVSYSTFNSDVINEYPVRPSEVAGCQLAAFRTLARYTQTYEEVVSQSMDCFRPEIKSELEGETVFVAAIDLEYIPAASSLDTFIRYNPALEDTAFNLRHTILELSKEDPSILEDKKIMPYLNPNSRIQRQLALASANGFLQDYYKQHEEKVLDIPPSE